jgi:hypothetical protein
MPGAPVPERTRRYLVGLLVLVLLLLVVTPAWFYSLSFSEKRDTNRTPAWMDSLATRKELTEKLNGETLARTAA